MDVERRKDGWVVSMTHEERAEIVTDGGHPPSRAVAAVADQASVDVDKLHSVVVRTSGGDGGGSWFGGEDMATDCDT